MKFPSFFFFTVLFIGSACSRQIPSKPYLQELSVPEISYSSVEPFPIISSIKKKPTQRHLIVIDPGHGGEDFGAHSVGTPQYQEKSLNLSTAEMLRRYLEQFGYSVHMTRNSDVFISLENRAALANAQRPRLFISVHYNSAPSKSAEGIEVFYYKSDEDVNRTKQSQLLAQSILKQVIKNTHAKSRGVKHGNFAVIRETKMPSVLVEGGFLTNSNEMQKIKDANYLKSLALGIAQGIRDYLKADLHP